MKCDQITATPNYKSWHSHDMETFSMLLAFCQGNSPVIGECPSQRPNDAEHWCLHGCLPEKAVVKKVELEAIQDA